MGKTIKLTIAVLLLGVVLLAAGCGATTGPGGAAPQVVTSDSPSTTATSNPGSTAPQVTPGDPSSTTTTNAPVPRPVAGSPAPDFTLKATDGETITLSSLQGHPVLLNFWATWCPPCKAEIPYLQDLSDDQDRLDAGLEIVAVDVKESREDVVNFMQNFGMTYRVLLDTTTEVTGLYNIQGIPTTFFIGEDGIINYVRPGTFSSKQEIEAILDKTIMKK